MSTYAEHFAEDRRLCILKILADAPEYSANDYLLQAALRNHGHSVSLDLVRTDLAWLQEQGLLMIAGAQAIRVAQLTTRGLDVSAGRASVPGVKRPMPG